MTVNGQTETVKSAFYEEYAANEYDEAEIDLFLFKDAFSQAPTEEPSFYVNIEVSESLNGKTLDLTKPLDQSKTPKPYLYISAVGNGKDFDIDYKNNTIEITDNATVTSGTLTATKNGNKFTVKLSIKLSNGNSITADWEGMATKVSFK